MTAMMTLMLLLTVADVKDDVGVLDYDGDNIEKLLEEREWVESRNIG